MIDRKKYFVKDDYVLALCKQAANATSTEELAKICQRMYIADYINLDGIDLSLAKHALTAVYRVLKKYSALRRRINYFGTLSGLERRKDDLFAFLYPDSDSEVRKSIKKLTDQTVKNAKTSFKNRGLAMAFYAESGGCYFGGIIIDEEDFDEQEVLERLRYSEKTGFAPQGCSTVNAIVDHELGHILDFWLDIKGYSVFKEAIKPFDTEYIGKNLSRYCVEDGTTNHAEVIAEGFAESRHNPHPRKIAAFVGRLIDQEYQRMLKNI